MKRKIGDYVINTDLITHIHKSNDMYYSNNSNQQTWTSQTEYIETICINFGESFIYFSKNDNYWQDALNLYNEFENEAKLQNT